MRKTWFQRLRYGLAATLVAGLVLLAVSMSLLRLAIAFAPELRGEAERVLAQALERPLTLGGMRASWAGLHPRLTLEDVRLTDGPLVGLEVPELEVDIDLLRSLRDLRLHIAQLEVSGLEVQATYAADGAWQIQRVGNADVSQALPEEAAPRELPARVRLRNTVLQLTDLPSGKVYQLNPVALDLEGSDGSYALSGYLPLPDALGKAMRFRAEWRGDLRTDEYAGRLYLDGRRLRLPAVSSLLSRLTAVPALRGRADAELWLDIDGGTVQQASGNVSLANIALPRDADSWQTIAGQSWGSFHWQRQSLGWSLAIDDVHIASTSRIWPSTDLALRFAHADKASTLQLSSSYLHLGDLAVAAALLPALPDEMRQSLQKAEPTAELLEPRLSLSWAGGRVAEFDLRTRFRNAGAQAQGRWPGASSLAGELRASRAGGHLRLDSRAGELDFGQLFRSRLPFESLQGEAFWRIEDGRWTVEAPLLAVQNEDGRAQARLRVVGGEGESPLLDVRAHASDVDAASTSRYLPVAVMPPPVVRWLDEAGIRGRVERADMVLFGRANGFPYNDSSGVFDIRADVVDSHLSYRADWPAVTAADGLLRFAGRSMSVRLDRGRINDAAIEQARIGIAQMGRTPLEIDGKVRGSGDRLLGFLRNSPLGKNIRQQLDDMQLSGTHGVELQAVVPLKPNSKARLRGTVALDKAGYRIPSWNLQLDDLQGLVRFTERGVTAQSISGRYRDQPVVLQAATADTGDTERILISADLRAAPEVMLDRDVLAGVHGQADWQVQLELPAFTPPRSGQAAAPPELRVASDLAGVAVDLPLPIGKGAEQSRQLRLAMTIDRKGPGPVRLAYGEQLRGLLVLAGDGLTLAGAGIRLGGGEPALPDRGVAVSGRLEELDLNGWRPPRMDGVDAAAMQVVADVEIGRLQLLGQSFADSKIRVRPAAAGTELVVDGAGLAGDVIVPEDKADRVKIQLQKLHLQALPSIAATTTAGRASARPGQLPPLDVAVADLQLGDQALGQLFLTTRISAGGTIIDRFRIEGALVELDATGGWEQDSSRSRLELTLRSDNAGRLLAALGYADAMRNGSVKGSMDVSWNGHIGDFALPVLTGRLQLSVRNGQILSVEPGAGRLFGLLSIAELPRRLSLNFSDLFGRGFAFDRIESDLQLADGDAHTRQFYMRGPAARVDLDGRIGLADRDYDQRITVTPNVSSTLPAIGAVAAGPVGVVAGLVTQKLLEKEINKLTRYRYHVAGSWDAPRIEPLDSVSGLDEQTAEPAAPLAQGVTQ